MSDQPLVLVNAENQYALLKPDPDRPHWGLLGGVCMWVLSVALPQILPIPFLFAERARGNLPSPEEIAAGNLGVRLVIVSIIATALGHLIILAACWAVVTQFGRRPFLASLGWGWDGLGVLGGLLLVPVVIGAVFLIASLAQLVLPESETTLFTQMLRASDVARYMVAALAVLTAPFVEELIYRGMLYSGLRSRLPVAPSVLIVGAIFTLVHVQQYWGAWASLVGLTTLSFILTAIRAYTKSLLPCVVVHLVFNMIGATSILLGKF
jgi:membrane protease YdiL (CAAX protease family)